MTQGTAAGGLGRKVLLALDMTRKQETVEGLGLGLPLVYLQVTLGLG